jgi:hypothetical protein
MARTHFVKKARKNPGRCIVCNKEILTGEPYKWVKPRYRSKVVAHQEHTIPLGAISSSKMVPIWEAQAEVEKMEGADEVLEAIKGLAEAAREVAESYQEGIDNEREIFPDNDFSEREEKVEQLNEWAGELETAADEASGACDGGKEDAETNSEDNGEELDNADIEDAGLDAEHEAVQSVKELAGNCPTE